MSDATEATDTQQDKTWWEENQNFAIIMIVVVGVLLLFGIIMIVCMIKYPSFDFVDKLEDIFDGDSEEEDDKKTTSTAASARSEKAQKMRGKSGMEKICAPPLCGFATACIPFLHLPELFATDSDAVRRTSSAQTVPSLRLPTPGESAPSNRLPPIHPVNSNAFNTIGNVAASFGMPSSTEDAVDGKMKNAASDVITLDEDLESICDAASTSRRSGSIDSGAVLDDLNLNGRVGLTWNREVANDIPSVGGGGGGGVKAGASRGAWTTSISGTQPM